MHLLVSTVIFSAYLIVPSTTCLAAGVCGGGCMPPPPMPSCMGGCGGGYACGSNGCYRMRARAKSSKTLSIGGSSAVTQSPDEKFMECCQDRQLPDSCLSKCTYRTYTKAALQAMYFKQDACPIQAATDIQYCAAQGMDHRQCCMNNGVGTTLAGGKCLIFCDQRPGNVTQLDMTYIACYDRFEEMKNCFWTGVTQQQQMQMQQLQQRQRARAQQAWRQTPAAEFSEDGDFDSIVTAPRAQRRGGGARTFRP
ncbi:hypothetical protein WR25_08561 isoform A [Diploscapter pachys]|uniref:Domain of unknown function DB domain-containing protein n=2 Tax=Diploscapter pachys TaxID=2018661 RepID=A0A2A2JKW2_9BILA|nr:hypothetical protein WR25_08561 isoform A [Diploscapter pachys]